MFSLFLIYLFVCLLVYINVAQSTLLSSVKFINIIYLS